MKYNTFIFDFDFTLVDATAGIMESFNYALNQVGFASESCEKIRKTVGMTLTNAFFQLTAVSDEQKTELFISSFKYMADKVMADNTVLFDDSLNVLSRLKKSGFNTAIVTNKLHYRIDEVLNNYGIVELIDYIVGFEDVLNPKPSPEGLLKAIEHFGNAKQSALYIGDSLIDANTAANAGVDFAAVTTGTTTKQELLTFQHICIANNLTAVMDSINLA